MRRNVCTDKEGSYCTMCRGEREPNMSGGRQMNRGREEQK